MVPRCVLVGGRRSLVAAGEGEGASARSISITRSSSTLSHEIEEMSLHAPVSLVPPLRAAALPSNACTAAWRLQRSWRRGSPASLRTSRSTRSDEGGTGHAVPQIYYTEWVQADSKALGVASNAGRGFFASSRAALFLFPSRSRSPAWVASSAVRASLSCSLARPAPRPPLCKRASCRLCAYAGGAWFWWRRSRCCFSFEIADDRVDRVVVALARCSSCCCCCCRLGAARRPQVRGRVLVASSAPTPPTARVPPSSARSTSRSAMDTSRASSARSSTTLDVVLRSPRSSSATRTASST